MAGPTVGGWPPGGWQVIAFCNPLCPPSTFTFGNTSGTLFSGRGEGETVQHLTIISAGDLDFDCDEFDGQSDLVIFEVLGEPVEKVTKVAYAGYEGLLEDIEVCFGGEYPFTDKYGEDAVFVDSLGPSGLYVGVLPDCDVAANPWWARLISGSNPPPAGTAPCVVHRDLVDGTAIVFVLTEPGDPVIRVG